MAGNHGPHRELEARALIDGRLLDERGERRAGALAEVGEDPHPGVEHQRQLASDVAQEERLAGEIPERRLVGGKEPRQGPVSRLCLVDWIPRSGIWVTEDRQLVRLRAREAPENR